MTTIQTTRRRILAAGGAATLFAPSLRAQPARTIKLGVLSDFNGPFAATCGTGSVAGVKLAVEDFLAGNPGVAVEVLQADHQNNPDTGSGIARRWFDVDGVAAVLDVVNSAVALAVSTVTRQANRTLLATAAGTTRLITDQCSPNTILWTFDTYAYGNTMGQVLTQDGGSSWFFITANYAFGQDLQAQTTGAVTRAGGRVIGSALHPTNTSDYSSFMLQAQSSGAKVIAIASGGNDMVGAIKQAVEFGVMRTQKVAPIMLGIVDVHSLGLETAQGLVANEPFYWNLNDQTRAWTKRYLVLQPGNYPTMQHAGAYSAALHFLHSSQGTDPLDGRAMVAAMKARPTRDAVFGEGSIRADGRKMLPMYLFTVKRPSDSGGPWDYYNLVETVPAERALPPMDPAACPMAKG